MSVVGRRLARLERQLAIDRGSQGEPLRVEDLDSVSGGARVSRVMDQGVGGDAPMMVDAAVGPSTRIPARYYRVGARKRYVRRRGAARRRSYGSRGMQVYRPMNLVAANIRGRGDYWTDFKDTVKRAIPSGSFKHFGTEMGSGLGNMFSKLVGFGDYSMSKNSLTDTSRKMHMGIPVPMFGNISNGTCVQHREFITEIRGTGSPNFSLQSFPLNPGMNSTFPWLAAMSNNYEQYEFKGMVFEFKSLSSDSTGGAATALGAITMATDYDSSEADFTSKAQMEQSQYCTSGKPSIDILHPIECAPNRTSVTVNYIRNGSNPPGTDIRLYDLGKFQIALSGIPAASAPVGALIGELWVTYDIVLYKPQQNPVFSPDFGIHWGLNGAGQFTTASPLSAPGVTAVFPRLGSSLGCYIGPNPQVIGATNNDSFIFPPGFTAGNYELNCLWVGAAVNRTVAISAAIGVVGSGAVAEFIALPNLANGAASQVGSDVLNPTGTVSSLVFSFRVASQTRNTNFILIAGTQSGTASFADFFLTKIPSGLTT